MAGDACRPSLGIRYANSAAAPSSKHPMSVFYTPGGQISGVGVTVFGHSWISFIGPAAQPTLVRDRFWRPVAGARNTWEIFVSFRGPQDVCSNTPLRQAVGDRLFINQDTINVGIPLRATDATASGYTPGSCINSMGQHFLYDLSSAPQPSWVEGNLMPVIPMYYPPQTGFINAFFITTPVMQDGSTSFKGAADWDFPPIPTRAMCLNWCSSRCPGNWKTPVWSTMHIFLNPNWSNVKCPTASSSRLERMIGRTCPANTNSIGAAGSAVGVQRQNGRLMPPEGAM